MSAHKWGTPNNSLSGNHQLIWDSTSLGLFKTCPRKYQLTMLEGWSKAQVPPPLWFGIQFHSAVEKAEHLRAEGLDHTIVLREILRTLLFENGTRKDKTWTPIQTGDSKRNLWTLRRSVIWYLDKFKNDPAETVRLKNGKPAVELSFKLNLDLDAPNGEPYLLSGHIDRLVRFNGRTWVMDHKTSGNGLGDFFWANFSPNNQVSLYTLAGQIIYREPVEGVMINGVELAVGHNRFSRGFAPRTEAQLQEYLRDLKITIKQAEGFADMGYWPMNDESCGKYGGCPFRNVCNKDPAVRHKFLAGDFTRQVWDPSRSR